MVQTASTEGPAPPVDALGSVHAPRMKLVSSNVRRQFREALDPPRIFIASWVRRSLLPVARWLNGPGRAEPLVAASRWSSGSHPSRRWPAG
jgi:hypothetical protein